MLIIITLIFILLLSFILFFYNSFIFWTAFKLKKNNAAVNNLSVQNEFSIIISAKNEENNLLLLFDSLTQLNYAEDKFEVIFINDHSSDNTLDILKAETNKYSNYFLINASSKTLPAKKGALTLGIKEAKNEFILITDADCVIEPGWLKAYSEKFNEGYDLLFGKAPLFKKNTFVSGLSCFENLRTHMLTFTASNYNLPYSASARNFGFRKSVWELLGGYSKTLETVGGDDDLFIREAAKQNRKIGVVTKNNSRVFSDTPSTWEDYFNQKARHTSTSIHYLRKIKLHLGIWHLTNILSIVFLLFSPLMPVLAVPFIIKIFFDLITAKSFQNTLNYNFNINEIVFYQILFELLLGVNFINGLRKSQKW